MNTENLDEVLREYIDDGGSREVYELAMDELNALETEHKFAHQEIDKLNTVMSCGHLARYQFQENGTQYCSLCQYQSLLNYLGNVSDVLESFNEDKHKELSDE